MEKLILIQNELKAPKNQYNNFGKYKYRNCEDILEAVKPLLSKHGCLLLITDDIQIYGERVYVKSTVEFNDGKLKYQTSALAREPLNKKGMDESQITGACSSYARKYALNGLFLIDDTKDNDSDELKNQQQEKAIEVVSKIIKDIPKCDSLDELQMLWESYPEYHNEIKTAVSNRKTQLTKK